MLAPQIKKINPLLIIRKEIWCKLKAGSKKEK